MEKLITVVGAANVDLIMRLERLPAVGESVTGGEFFQTFGGKGANQAVAASRAGGQTAFIACIGDDAFGERYRESLQADGVDTSGVYTEHGVPTGTALILFDQKGDNYLGVASGANAALLPLSIEEQAPLIARSSWILLQMEIPYPTVHRALEIAKQHGVPSILNCAPARPADIALCEFLQGLVVNEVEASALSGMPIHNPTEALVAAEKLRALGPAFVIVTMGADGAAVVSDTVWTCVPAFPINPIDTTAAGDTFCGALAVALAEGEPLVKAVRFGCAAAALAATRIGAQPSIPHRSEIEARLDEMRDQR